MANLDEILDASRRRYESFARETEERLAALSDLISRANERTDRAYAATDRALAMVNDAYDALDRIARIVGKHGDTHLINEVCGVIGQYQELLAVFADTLFDGETRH
jgi:hypothetical protein